MLQLSLPAVISFWKSSATLPIFATGVSERRKGDKRGEKELVESRITELEGG